ncbi:HlyD family efflux transporter periplasmic adaptor subunit [Demequina muriae]|uniref:HlyD family efflux transporter periplasmic adaptor subunit n=1 Tax=Demequina muriae TaxID=3051664 RepID=A0ABT8GIJ3_9MICO|nr:HlyD family efflux transporter periplasmic adaptor subunit [Demequina sp. EGI L300058]MDN4480781.1 HlyD family efflux transporter periplasmic adaptor subunit [Demequina sp. EGI L300058]
MTWGNRFKLVIGVVMVLIIVAAATLVFNQRQNQVASASATIKAASYGVGTDYGGLVEAAYVAAGDVVVEGQRMFEVQSLQLERDIDTGAVSPAENAVVGGGTLVIRAGTDGTVSHIALNSGAYAGAGEVLASIDASGSLFAEAEFILTPRDFGRLEDAAGVELRLPDQREISGTVSDLTVETVDGVAHVTARIDSDALADIDGDPLMKPGTPLEATLHLRDDGPFAGVSDMVSDLADRVGL